MGSIASKWVQKCSCLTSKFQQNYLRKIRFAVKLSRAAGEKPAPFRAIQIVPI